MTRKELEKQEKETRNLIEELGRLSSNIQTPPDFLSRVMTKAEQLSPPRKRLRGWLPGWSDAPRTWATVLVASLVLLVIWPLGALKVARDREQATLTQIAQLKEELEQQHELLKELRQLIERADRRAYADFKLGKYEQSWQEYLQAAKQEPDKEDVYLFRAALALWYDCRFEKARELLDSYVQKHPDDLWGHFALGTTYHSLGDYQAAMFQYKKILGTQDKGEIAEAAWFNVAVIQAVELQKNKDNSTLRSVMASLERSIELAHAISIARGKERINKIQAALTPIFQRPPKRCVENYATDDLSSLAKEEVFLDWLKRQKARLTKSF